jgi:hypothetical protein
MKLRQHTFIVNKKPASPRTLILIKFAPVSRLYLAQVRGNLFSLAIYESLPSLPVDAHLFVKLLPSSLVVHPGLIHVRTFLLQEPTSYLGYPWFLF